MPTSTIITITQSGTGAIRDYFGTLLPVLIPVAIGFAIFFGIIYWIYGRARRH